MVLLLTAMSAQGDLYSAPPLTQAGQIMPFGEILQRVTPQVAGRYIGAAEFDRETLTYRLKFLNNGVVVNVDVDARTGRILNRRQSY